MKEALEQGGRFLPANAQSAEVLNPADGALDLPAPLVPSHRSAILRHVLRLAIRAVWRDHLDAFFRQLIVQFVAVIRLMALRFGRYFGAQLGLLTVSPDFSTASDRFSPDENHLIVASSPRDSPRWELD